MPTKNLHRLGRVGTVAWLACAPAVAHAQGGGFPIDQTYQTISNWTLIIAQFLDILTWFVFSFLVFLLDPKFMFDMTNGKAGSLLDVLNLIWQLSRDLMNVAFALGLVGAAIYTVVTANKEFVASHLKSFVMAVVLVNFSWFIPQVVLDIANVATVTVYSIPSAIVSPDAECRYTSTKSEGCFDEQPATEPGMKSCACKAVADFKPFPDKLTSDTLKASKDGWQCNIGYCIRYVKLDPATSTKQGTVINGLVVNHARLSQMAVITRTKVDSKIADLLLFILRQMFVIIIHIALFFPLLALVLGLIIRIPILWFTMAFMPIYFLSWVVPDEVPFMGEVKEKAKKIWDLFLKAAFLPAVVAVPLTVGFIMANAGTRVNFAGMEAIPFNLIDGMGSFAQLLWVMMVLAILWSGTFAALELMMADMPGGSFVGKIKSTGEEAGKFAAELPLATIPVPGPTNALGLANLLRPSALRQALRSDGGLKDHFTERGQTLTAAGTAAKNIASDKTGDKEKNLRKAVEDFSKDNVKGFEGLRQALLDAGGISSVDRNNVDVLVKNINESLKKDHGRRDDIADMTKFNRAIDAMRRAAPAPAPAANPNPAPPAPNTP